MTTDLIMRVDVRTTTTTITTTAALEARDLKTAYRVYIYISLATTTIVLIAAVSLISTPRVDQFSEK